MHLKWSAFALADRAAIFDYIEADNPRAAITIDERIRTCVMGWRNFLRWEGLAGLREHGSWSFLERPILLLIGSMEMRFGYCAYSMVRSNGRTK